jgi:patatin-like phospholipase/acyl hydrolase
MQLDEVHYVAFQGGGGKGFAHLGAVQYFESQGYSPISGSLGGVSGASAGALTAFFVAMGYSSAQIRSAFEALDPYDKFEIGKARSLGKGGGTYSSKTKRPNGLEITGVRALGVLLKNALTLTRLLLWDNPAGAVLAAIIF